jgi:hypothetical protein
VGCIKRFKNKIVKRRKWHILREKYLKLEEIKEERTTRLQQLLCTLVLTVALQYNITEFVKNVVPTEGNKQ